MNINKKYENKVCKHCLVDLDAKNTNKYSFDHAKYMCKVCEKQQAQKKYAARKEIIREQQRVYDLSVKIKVIEGYGGKCCCPGCTVDTVEFLTINNNLSQPNNGKLYRWLIANNFPKDNYYVICCNCNNGQENFGSCPHNRSSSD